MNPRGRSLDQHARSVLAGRAAAASAEVSGAALASGDGRAAAFFDVDNTVIQGATLFHLARGLHQREFVSTADILKAAWDQAYFRMVGVEHPAALANARASALAFIAGHPVVELESVGAEIYDEVIAQRVWPGTRALAQSHLDRGERVWLVTAAPVEIAHLIAHRLGLTGALGTVSEHVDGVYTGRLVGDLLHGEAKAEAVLALAEREGLDLAACSAYSDSYNDLPLLSLVGHPVAVNPDGRLRDHARRLGWPVRDYRTGRKAARVALAATATAGMAAGGLGAAQRLRRRRRDAGPAVSTACAGWSRAPGRSR